MQKLILSILIFILLLPVCAANAKESLLTINEGQAITINSIKGEMRSLERVLFLLPEGWKIAYKNNQKITKKKCDIRAIMSYSENGKDIARISISLMDLSTEDAIYTRNYYYLNPRQIIDYYKQISEEGYGANFKIKWLNISDTIINLETALRFTSIVEKIAAKPGFTLGGDSSFGEDVWYMGLIYIAHLDAFCPLEYRERFAPVFEAVIQSVVLKIYR